LNEELLYQKREKQRRIERDHEKTVENKEINFQKYSIVLYEAAAREILVFFIL
jgi:hypothetical protein